MKTYHKRILKLPKNRHFFLFGARNTGKSTLLEHSFERSKCLWIDLLDWEEEDRLSRNPNDLANRVMTLESHITHVIIDEIQKIPRLLDTVHRLMKQSDKYFILTGSSARKLRQGGANLLAGRAFVYNLFPFSSFELEDTFSLDQSLAWGTLPSIFEYDSERDYRKFLQSYALTYLKEDIVAEQSVRNLDPFRKFLEVAAQSNGMQINYSKMSRDVGVDDKTIKQYFSILEDTLILHQLPAFQHSFRKQLNTKHKIYFFDNGVAHALQRNLSVPLRSQTSAYGEAFEQFIIMECIKLSHYFKDEYQLSYLKTKDGAEIDLVIERPGLPILFIEIKSKNEVRHENLRNLQKLSKDFGDCEAICLSQDPYTKQLDSIKVYPWKQGLKAIFMDE